MGFLTLLNRVDGNRRSIDFSPLKDQDVIVLVDNSTRMLRKGRWDEVGRVIGKLATKVWKCNNRGIVIHFLNQQAQASTKLKTRSKTVQLFDETTLYYGQPIGARLNDLFNQYVRDSYDEDIGRTRVILVVSDGMSTDDLESVLANISKRLDELEWSKTQLKIQLVQVGNDWSATQFLQRLKEDLPAKHNITDLVSIELCDGSPLTIAKLEGVLSKGFV
ncbi:hypothetical protein BDM02DRAFT_3184230 [Thelephora ganbajun]|uniref:Uncharacterized protein n=1 Tax=Thelephora ganbajun TaxID=370292 RepID=A0ACB6ZQA4_THEGA|nr:hypothetical protein BDM02DRAFT_3184230 [Thelephora ganbajun]